VPTLAQRYLPAILYVMFAGALISAILSTVDSALLAAASLVSHNLVLRLKPDVSETAKIAFARAGVALLGVVAYALAISAEGISSLVELASAFATAGIFVALVFGLFTGWGGAPSAYAAIATGALVWAYGRLPSDLLCISTRLQDNQVEWCANLPVVRQAPYVSGLLAAVLAYVLVGVLARLLAADRRAQA